MKHHDSRDGRLHRDDLLRPVAVRRDLEAEAAPVQRRARSQPARAPEVDPAATVVGTLATARRELAMLAHVLVRIREVGVASAADVDATRPLARGASRRLASLARMIEHADRWLPMAPERADDLRALRDAYAQAALATAAAVAPFAAPRADAARPSEAAPATAAADPAGVGDAADRGDTADALAEPATDAVPPPADTHAVAAAGVASASAPLPHLAEIQRSFGRHDVSHVRATIGGAVAAASDALGADAYATGDRVGFASAPSLHTAAHEAAHVIQQQRGVQLAGGLGAAGDRYEQHADAVADAVVRGESAEALLGAGATGGSSHAAIQRKEKRTDARKVADRYEEDRSVIPPKLVDEMIIGTEVIYRFVERAMASGMKADGLTFFYTSTEALAQGMAKHWDRMQFVDGQMIAMTDAQVLAQARALAHAVVGATMSSKDNTVHINLKADGLSFRTTLHEAMHQQVRLRGAQLGFEANEGLAEYLSEIVLRAHGLDFTAYGRYRAAYNFIKVLDEVFGRDQVLRFALLDGIGVLREAYMQYAPDGETGWRKVMKDLRGGRYAKVEQLLRTSFVAHRARLEPDEAAADQHNAEFWEEASEMEQAQQTAHDREMWPAEGRGKVEARIVNISGVGSMFARLTLSRGGQHGVREGWMVQFDTSSELYPLEPFVAEVRGKSCDVLIQQPRELLANLGGQRVFLRKP